MPTNDFLPFGTALGANVLPQGDYSALPARTAGFAAGLAESEELNKVWRQAAFVSAMLMQWAMEQDGEDSPDDGDLAAAVTRFNDDVMGLFARLSGQQNFIGAQAVLPTTIAYAASITPNCLLSDTFVIGTLEGDLTLNNPSSLLDGQSVNVTFRQDATGGRQVTYGSKFKFINGASNVQPHQSANKRSLLSGKYIAVYDIIVCTMLPDF